MRRIVIALFILAILSCPRPSDSQEGRSIGSPVKGRSGFQDGLADKAVQQEENSLPYPYDQNIMAPRLFQKTLPPLTKKEKVIWSFRTAKANIFL